MSREMKKYRLRATRRPMRNEYVASAARVVDERGRSGYCYIGFDEPLVDAVGSKLPRGVAPFDPAYLSITYDWIKQVWVIAARYIADDVFAIMWETATKPSWLKYTSYEDQNDHSATDASHSLRPLPVYRFADRTAYA